jgi:hypothetical protein
LSDRKNYPPTQSATEFTAVSRSFDRPFTQVKQTENYQILAALGSFEAMGLKFASLQVSANVDTVYCPRRTIAGGPRDSIFSMARIADGNFPVGFQ